MSCQVGKLDMCVRHGDTAHEVNIQIFFSDDFGNFKNEPEELEGFNFYMEIRKGNNQVAYHKIGDGLIMREDNSLTISRVPVVEVPKGEYTYGLKMQEPNGTITTFLTGRYDVADEIVEIK